MHLRTGAVALLVGLTWGCTNPFLRRGSLAVEAASSGGPQSPQPVANTKTRAWLSLGGAWAVNQVGSALFVLLLGQGADISMAVPVANGISIAANAVVSVWRKSVCLFAVAKAESAASSVGSVLCVNCALLWVCTAVGALWCVLHRLTCCWESATTSSCCCQAVSLWVLASCCAHPRDSCGQHQPTLQLFSQQASASATASAQYAGPWSRRQASGRPWSCRGSSRGLPEAQASVCSAAAAAERTPGPHSRPACPA